VTAPQFNEVATADTIAAAPDHPLHSPSIQQQPNLQQQKQQQQETVDKTRHTEVVHVPSISDAPRFNRDKTHMAPSITEEVIAAATAAAALEPSHRSPAPQQQHQQKHNGGQVSSVLTGKEGEWEWGLAVPCKEPCLPALAAFPWPIHS